MNNLICQQLFLLLLKYGKVSKEEKDIYLYGIEIILEKAEKYGNVVVGGQQS